MIPCFQDGISGYLDFFFLISSPYPRTFTDYAGNRHKCKQKNSSSSIFRILIANTFLQHAIWYFNLYRAGEATDDCPSLKAQFSITLCPQWFENCQIKDSISLKDLEWLHCVMETVLDIRKYCRIAVFLADGPGMQGCHSCSQSRDVQEGKTDVFLEG